MKKRKKKEYKVGSPDLQFVSLPCLLSLCRLSLISVLGLSGVCFHTQRIIEPGRVGLMLHVQCLTWENSPGGASSCSLTLCVWKSVEFTFVAGLFLCISVSGHIKSNFTQYRHQLTALFPSHKVHNH